jgi:hypothetical protein
MSNITRSQRESRAFALVVATGGFSIATVVLAVLAVVGIGGFGLVILSAIIATVCYVVLRSTLKG